MVPICISGRRKVSPRVKSVGGHHHRVVIYEFGRGNRVKILFRAHDDVPAIHRGP